MTQVIPMPENANSTVVSEAHPDGGALVICGVRFEAQRWVDEDGAHIIRSTEFDVYGQGDDWSEAFQSFLSTADDLFQHFSSLIEAEEATEEEARVALDLGQKLIAAYQGWTKILNSRIEELERRRVNFRGRSGGPRFGDLWQSQALMTSRLLSHA